MKKQLIILFGICVCVLCVTEQAAAQKAKNTEGYTSFSYEELKKQKKLSDLSPEASGSTITSFSCTVACEGKDLNELTFTGDSLTAQFFALTAQCAPARCLCYFDKVVTAKKPLKGFVIEVKK